MPLTIDAAPVAHVVKQETSVLHREVEEIMLPRLQQIRSLSDYARLLQMFYGFYRPLQQAIQLQLGPHELPDIAKRRTATLIEADLATLGYKAKSARGAALPEITTVPQAFGALYVLEGSTLGGKIIARMLAKNTHVPIPSTALNFFSGYGEETGPMWVAFLAVLNRQSDGTSIVAAANQTFLCLKQWMRSFYETTES